MCIKLLNFFRIIDMYMNYWVVIKCPPYTWSNNHLQYATTYIPIIAYPISIWTNALPIPLKLIFAIVKIYIKRHQSQYYCFILIVYNLNSSIVIILNIYIYILICICKVFKISKLLNILYKISCCLTITLTRMKFFYRIFQVFYE